MPCPAALGFKGPSPAGTPFTDGGPESGSGRISNLEDGLKYGKVLKDLKPVSSWKKRPISRLIRHDRTSLSSAIDLASFDLCPIGVCGKASSERTSKFV